MAELGAALTAYRPELEATDEARDAARFLLLDPPLPWAARPGYGLIATGGVAVLPGWARRALRLPAGGRGPRWPRGSRPARHRGAVRWAMAGVAEERQLAAEGDADRRRRRHDRDELLDAGQGALHVAAGGAVIVALTTGLLVPASPGSGPTTR